MRKKLKYTDSSTYWRQRSNRPGQKSVMWRNETFNMLFREEQKKILYSLFDAQRAEPLKVLEYGCGIGVFSKMLAEIFSNAHITGIDFPEMITVANERNAHPRIKYICSSAEDFKNSDETYDLIVSSGCISAIMNHNLYKDIFQNMKNMLTPTGKILFIDPFHNHWPLARVPMGVQEITKKLGNVKMKPVYVSGICFWPVRILIANSQFPDLIIINLFYFGEIMLSILGKQFWSDYKILLFNHVQM